MIAGPTIAMRDFVPQRRFGDPVVITEIGLIDRAAALGVNRASRRERIAANFSNLPCVEVIDRQFAIIGMIVFGGRFVSGRRAKATRQ